MNFCGQVENSICTYIIDIQKLLCIYWGTNINFADCTHIRFSGKPKIIFMLYLNITTFFKAFKDLDSNRQAMSKARHLYWSVSLFLSYQLFEFYYLCLEVYYIRYVFPLLKLIMNRRWLEPETSKSIFGCATTEPNMLGLVIL